jgi:hypothetical protein
MHLLPELLEERGELGADLGTVGPFRSLESLGRLPQGQPCGLEPCLVGLPAVVAAPPACLPLCVDPLADRVLLLAGLLPRLAQRLPDPARHP